MSLAQNLIQNPGFEDNPPSRFGNNIGHPIAPWIVTGGSRTNVVRVDGPGGFAYERASDGRPSGPESDATAPGAGIPQHYLDIVGTNDFFQSFTVPVCMNGAGTQVAQYAVSGFFSTRDNRAGTGAVRLHEGVGLSGPEVPGTRDNVTLAANTTALVPLWTEVAIADNDIDLTVNQTFSYGVTVTQNINFDDASVMLTSLACPSLAINKTTSSVPEAAGDRLQYQFEVTNDSQSLGNAPAITVNEVDLADPKCTATPVLVSATVALDNMLEAGETQVYECTSIPVTQAEIDARLVENTVTVSGEPSQGEFGGPQTGSAATPVVVEIVANPETFDLVDGGAGGTTASVLTSDILDGQSIDDPDDVILTFENSTGGLTLDPVTNGIVVPAGLAPGTFTLTYMICDALDPDNCATVTETVVVGAGGIGIVKSSTFDDQNGDGAAQTGETITYTYEVSNLGDFDLSPVLVTETGFTGAGTTPVPQLTGGDDGDFVLEDGEIFIFTATYALVQADIDAGLIDNSATATGETPDGVTVSDVSDSQNPGDGDGTGTPGPGGANDEPTTTALANADIDAQDDAIDDPVDATTDLFAVVDIFADNGNGQDTLSGAPTDETQVTVNTVPGNLPPAGVTLNPDGTVDVAAGTAPGLVTFDYEICEIGNANNCDIATITFTIGDGGIGIIKSAAFNDEITSDGNAQVGETISYTYLVANEGDLPLSDVTVTETGFTGNGTAPTPVFVSGDDGDDILEVGETWTYTATYTLIASDITDGAVDNQATAAADLPGGTRVTDLSDSTGPADGDGVGTSGDGANNDDPTSVPLVSAAIIANDDVLAAPIDATSAQIDVLNVFDDNGNGPDTLGGAATDATAADVTVVPTAPTPPGITLNPDGSIDVAAGTAPGDFTFEYQICEILNPANCDTATVTLTVGEGSLGVVKSSVFNDDISADGAGQVGETITYTYTVTNTGDFDLSNPELVETGFTGAGTTPTPVLTGGDDGDGIQQVGEIFTYSATYTLVAADLAAGGVDNQATASGTTPGGTLVSDLSDSTNSGDGDGVGTADSGLGNDDVTSTPFAVSTIVANDDVLPDPVDPFVEQLAVLNVLTPTAGGDADMLNGAQATTVGPAAVVISPDPANPLPAGFTLNANGDVDVAQGTAPGIFTFGYQICEAGNLANCDFATVQITVGSSGIGILKSSEFNDENFDGAAQVGETIDYTYTVTNEGDLPLSNVVVTEPAAGFTGAGPAPTPVFVGGDDGDDILEVGETWFYSATYTLLAADIDAGGVSNLAAVEGTTPAGETVTDSSDSQNPGDGDGIAAAGPGDDDPTVTPLTPATIVAQDDTVSGVDGLGGMPAALNIFGANGNGADTLQGTPTNAGAVDIAVLTPAASINGGPVPFLNTSTGDVDVPPGTPAGTYEITYEICETLNPGNCDTATVTLVVADPDIDAVDNDFTAMAVDGALGGDTPTVFSNDTIDGLSFADAGVVASIVDNDGLAGVTINPDGTLSVPAGSAPGVFEVVYEICDALNPDNCDTAVATIQVGTIAAVAESFDTINGAIGGTTPSVLTSDVLNGASITDPSDVVLTVIGSTGGLSLDPVTNGIIVPAGTPVGSFTLTYEICDASNPAICSTVTETVVVGEITAVAETFEPTPAGGTTALSVLASDTLNGAPVTPDNVTLQVISADAPLSLNPDGTVNIAPGTPAGPLNLTYEICDAANPDNCSSVMETIQVLAEPEIVAIKIQTLVDNGDGIDGAGDRLDYTITLSNTGNIDLSSVTADDTISDGDGNLLTLDSGPDFVSGNAGSPEGNLAIGETATYVASYTLTTGDVNSGLVSNTVIATGEPVRPAGFFGPLAARVSDTSDEGDTGNGSDNPTIFTFGAQNFVSGLSIVKTAAVSTVTRGGVVPYTLQITNNNPAQAVGAITVDTLPAGFVFVEGSATIGGVPTSTVTVAGRVVSFPTVIVPAGGSQTITLVARVLTGAPAGEATNRAVLLDTQTRAVLAPAGTATVRIEPEAVFDCGDVIGKVYDDQNGNGYQDQGEPGLPAARVVAVDGTIITTDEFGRFHVPCAVLPEARGSNFILKLDERSLPTGYRVTTENPRVVRLTRGKLTELNFGAALGRVVRVDVNSMVFGMDGGGKMQLVPAFRTGMETLLDRISDSPSTIRLAFHVPPGANDVQRNTARDMARDVRRYIERRWRRIGNYRLNIETTFVRGN